MSRPPDVPAAPNRAGFGLQVAEGPAKHGRLGSEMERLFDPVQPTTEGVQQGS